MSDIRFSEPPTDIYVEGDNFGVPLSNVIADLVTAGAILMDLVKELDHPMAQTLDGLYEQQIEIGNEWLRAARAQRVEK